ncbi:MAG: GDSL-type esterase/lipase family protein [Ruminococcus sp.]|nr:GDSL-type esterase/lipase family protein [Ruminococcus sp.]
MKRIMEDFFGHFFSNPLLPLLIIFCSVSAMLFTGDNHSERAKKDMPEYVRTTVPLNVTTAAETSSQTTSSSDTVTTSAMTLTVVSLTVETTSTTTEASTTATSEAEESTSTATQEDTAEPHAERPYVSDYRVSAGADSPNSSYYQEHLAILGDSIAYGFNAYGYIPYEHNIAKESMALWNMGNYTFDVGGGAMGAVDAAKYTDSPLIYISIGMNDIFTYSPEGFADTLCSIAQQLVDAIPDTTVVIGSISPVSVNNYYTTNDRIDSFNSAVEAAVDNYGSSQILFFDANAVLKDPNTGALAANVSGADGLHLTGSSYSYLLNAMFNMLDSYDTASRIEAHDSKYE